VHDRTQQLHERQHVRQILLARRFWDVAVDRAYYFELALPPAPGRDTCRAIGTSARNTGDRASRLTDRSTRAAGAMRPR
jgi:hypothetical protein